MEKTNENKLPLGKKISILMLTLVGFITTVKLAMIYYNANFNPYALSSFCSINEFIDCDGIAKTSESQFFGVPLAYWGLFLYSFITMLIFAPKLKNFKLLSFLEVFKNPLDYIAALGLISFVISMILLCISLFEIKKLCVLCACTYVINLIIALVAADWKNGHFIKAFKNSVLDMFAALKIKKYLIAFGIVLLAAIGFFSWTTTSKIFTPQLKQQNPYQEFIQSRHNKYSVKGNTLGDENATVVIYAYSDYECPICCPNNIMLHKLAKEVKNLKIVHKNMPLDMECNKYLKTPFHHNACLMARYAVAAEKQGKFWEMDSLLFEKQPKNEEEILKIAKSIRLDLDKLKTDANSEETKKHIEAEIEDAASKGINGTPAMQLGKNIYIGIRPYEDLKKLVIEAGAKAK